MRDEKFQLLFCLVLLGRVIAFGLELNELFWTLIQPYNHRTDDGHVDDNSWNSWKMPFLFGQ